MRKFLVLAAALAAAVFVVPASAGAGVRPHSVGLLDCNGRSPVQKSVRVSLACSDPRSIYEGKSVHFFDNGQYIGHDEPIIRFLSNRHGSGNDVTWIERLPRDPKALPTVKTPGSDVTHWFELSIAPWFSMALCNSQSYPLNPCKPRSDSNAPKHPPTFDRGGGGSSFLEMQFYAPGFAPFVDNESLRQHALVRVASHQRPRVHARVPELQLELHRADELRVYPDERRAHRPAEPAARDRCVVHA